MPSNYESVPSLAADVKGEDSPLKEEENAPPSSSTTMQNLSHRAKMSLAIIVILILIFVTVVAIAHSSSSNAAPTSTSTTASMLGSSLLETTVPPCTFDECYSSNCNADVAPYTCLRHNGGPHGGCSDIPWLETTCDKQCDLSGCIKLEIPDSTENCNVKCAKRWCEMGRLCGDSAPYQCTVGSSAFGCSSDKLMWTLKSSKASCSSCCNTNTC